MYELFVYLVKNNSHLTYCFKGVVEVNKLKCRRSHRIWKGFIFALTLITTEANFDGSKRKIPVLKNVAISVLSIEQLDNFKSVRPFSYVCVLRKFFKVDLPLCPN